MGKWLFDGADSADEHDLRQMLRDGEPHGVERMASNVLEQEGSCAAERFIAGYAHDPAFETMMAIARSMRRKAVVPVAVLPEPIAQEKPLLVVNGKIAMKLRRKHRIDHEDYRKLPALMRGLKQEEFVDISGKIAAGGKAEKRLVGWPRNESGDCWGYAVVWEAKERRSEIVSFFRLKTEKEYVNYMARQRATAMEVREQ